MSGRPLGWILGALVALALAGQTVRGHHRVQASRLLHQIELLTAAAMRAGERRAPILQANLQALRRAAELDPSEVGIPIARGSQLLLLGSDAAAIEAYRQALALEPRPETELNLGRALWRSGRQAEALEAFRRAVAVDPRLRRALPAGATLERRGR